MRTSVLHRRATDGEARWRVGRGPGPAGAGCDTMDADPRPPEEHVSGPTWTPAPRPGLVPLHPLGFGTLLGKAFAALRHNPKILFGFAVVVQIVVVVVTAVVLGAVGYLSFMRLSSMRPGSDDFITVLIGSSATMVVASLIVGLGATAFSAIIQGVVAADVAEAVLGNKPTLREVWRRVRPAA